MCHLGFRCNDFRAFVSIFELLWVCLWKMSFINIVKFNVVHMEAHNELHLSHIGVLQCSIPLRNQKFWTKYHLHLHSTHRLILFQLFSSTSELRRKYDSAYLVHKVRYSPIRVIHVLLHCVGTLASIQLETRLYLRILVWNRHLFIRLVKK